jgi:hypothetical protein
VLCCTVLCCNLQLGLVNRWLYLCGAVARI